MLRTFLSTLLRWFPTPTPTPTPPPPTAPVVVDVDEVIRRINAERAARQLGALVPLPLLNASAQDWADVMAARDRLDHGNFQGRMSAILPNTAAGEDVGEGTFTPAATVALWMNSPPHRANILGRWNVIGVGLARSRTGTPYWCADFDLTLSGPR